jgi:hypothetical protein
VLPDEAPLPRPTRESPRKTKATASTNAAHPTPKAAKTGADRAPRKASKVRPASRASCSVAARLAATKAHPCQSTQATAPRTRSLKAKTTTSPAKDTHARPAAAVFSAAWSHPGSGGRGGGGWGSGGGGWCCR